MDRVTVAMEGMVGTRVGWATEVGWGTGEADGTTVQ